MQDSSAYLCSSTEKFKHKKIRLHLVEDLSFMWKKPLTTNFLWKKPNGTSSRDFLENNQVTFSSSMGILELQWVFLREHVRETLGGQQSSVYSSYRKGKEGAIYVFKIATVLLSRWKPVQISTSGPILYEFLWHASVTILHILIWQSLHRTISFKLETTSTMAPRI